MENGAVGTLPFTYPDKLVTDVEDLSGEIRIEQPRGMR